MTTYKGNSGHLMQHWTLCELLVIAGKHTSGLNFIDAHAMAPLANEMTRTYVDRRFDRVYAGLPGQGTAYETAWHQLAPNGGYPNSAAFVEQVWQGDFSLLLCETDDATVQALRPWLDRVNNLERCRGTKLFQCDWRKEFGKGLPGPSEMGLDDGSLTLVSFDPDMYYPEPPREASTRNLYPSDLQTTLDALKNVKGAVILQLSTYSRGNRNQAPQDAVVTSVNSNLAGGEFTLAARVRLDGDMMSLVYGRDIDTSWSAELADLSNRFDRWCP